MEKEIETGISGVLEGVISVSQASEKTAEIALEFLKADLARSEALIGAMRGFGEAVEGLLKLLKE